MVTEKALVKQSIIEFDNENYLVAKDAAKKAIALNSNNYESFAKLGEIYCALGSYKKSLKAFNKSLESNPDCLEAQFNAVVCLAKLGRIEQANARLETAKAHPLYQGNLVFIDFTAKINDLIRSETEGVRDRRLFSLETIDNHSSDDAENPSAISTEHVFSDEDAYRLADTIMDQWIDEYNAFLALGDSPIDITDL